MSAKAHVLEKKWRSEDIKLEENVDFSALLLSDRVLKGLRKAGFQKPSPIQLKAIPLGRCGLDLVVQAKSGTGKTCVFTVIALESLMDVQVTQVLVVAPTREIAAQIHEAFVSIGSDIRNLKCCVVIGGLPVENDVENVQNCQIVIGTPGRIKHLINISALQVNSIRLFVLDEADKLLEDSFQPDINWIFSVLPQNKQVIAASATYPNKLASLVAHYMRNPSFVRLNVNDLALKGLLQFYCITEYHPVTHIAYEHKLEFLWKIVTAIDFSQCLIFTNYLTRVKPLCDDLNRRGFPTASLSSVDDQETRLCSLHQLKSFECRILVTSDLAARGIDAENVDLVINMDVPHDLETYLHRIGRSGRYGAKGVAITLVHQGSEEQKFFNLQNELNSCVYSIPDPLPSNLMKWSHEMAVEHIQKMNKDAPNNKDSVVEETKSAENIDNIVSSEMEQENIETIGKKTESTENVDKSGLVIQENVEIVGKETESAIVVDNKVSDIIEQTLVEIVDKRTESTENTDNSVSSIIEEEVTGTVGKESESAENISNKVSDIMEQENIKCEKEVNVTVTKANNFKAISNGELTCEENTKLSNGYGPHDFHLEMNGANGEMKSHLYVIDSPGAVKEVIINKEENVIKSNGFKQELECDTEKTAEKSPYKSEIQENNLPQKSDLNSNVVCNVLNGNTNEGNFVHSDHNSEVQNSEIEEKSDQLAFAIKDKIVPVENNYQSDDLSDKNSFSAPQEDARSDAKTDAILDSCANNQEAAHNTLSLILDNEEISDADFSDILSLITCNKEFLCNTEFSYESLTKDYSNFLNSNQMPVTDIHEEQIMHCISQDKLNTLKNYLDGNRRNFLFVADKNFREMKNAVKIEPVSETIASDNKDVVLLNETLEDLNVKENIKSDNEHGGQITSVNCSTESLKNSTCENTQSLESSSASIEIRVVTDKLPVSGTSGQNNDSVIESKSESDGQNHTDNAEQTSICESLQNNKTKLNVTNISDSKSIVRNKNEAFKKRTNKNGKSTLGNKTGARPKIKKPSLMDATVTHNDSAGQRAQRIIFALQQSSVDETEQFDADTSAKSDFGSKSKSVSKFGMKANVKNHTIKNDSETDSSDSSGVDTTLNTAGFSKLEQKNHSSPLETSSPVKSKLHKDRNIKKIVEDSESSSDTDDTVKSAALNTDFAVKNISRKPAKQTEASSRNNKKVSNKMESEDLKLRLARTRKIESGYDVQPVHESTYSSANTDDQYITKSRNNKCHKRREKQASVVPQYSVQHKSSYNCALRERSREYRSASCTCNASPNYNFFPFFLPTLPIASAMKNRSQTPMHIPFQGRSCFNECCQFTSCYTCCSGNNFCCRNACAKKCHHTCTECSELNSPCVDASSCKHNVPACKGYLSENYNQGSYGHPFPHGDKIFYEQQKCLEHLKSFPFKY